MPALAACFLAFVLTYWNGRSSLGRGLVSLVATGYLYGILRANFQTEWSHFIFDAALLGLYLSQTWRSSEPGKDLRTLQIWTAILIGWPCLVAILPFQPILISIVGLRGNILFIPLLLLAMKLKDRDLLQFSAGVAVLNVIALGFGVGEYVLGVPRFYPFGPVTQIIYNSTDVAEGFFRIPGTFTNAHAYGGAMVCSLPFLIGAWDRAETLIWRLLAVTGISAALVGILLSATRLNFLIGSAMVAMTILTSRLKPSKRIVFLLLIAAVGYAAIANERFQRFKSLGDTDSVTERVGGSLNRGFWEILIEYPLGNGLGGGGTSIPYFLQGQVRNPIGMENEYGRILCEQGIIGLLIWVAFVIWFLSRAKVAFAKSPWVTGRRMAWGLVAVLFGTAWIGTGLLTAIPQTVMMLLGIGWAATPDTTLPKRRSRGRRVPLNASASVSGRRPQMIAR